MKIKTFISALSVCICFGSTGLANQILFATEEYAPFNFTDGDAISGIGAEQVNELISRTGFDGRVELMNWSRAIGLAMRNANTCVFTTARTAEREPNFQWVGPLHVDGMVLIGKADNTGAAATLEEALELRIAAQAGDAALNVLAELGKTDIVTPPTQQSALKMLDGGRVDYVAKVLATAERLIAERDDLTVAFTLQRLELSIACSLSMEARLITALQASMDEMIEDGTQERIVATYQ